jgi:cleavage stimulation factor subunit 2
MNKNSVFVGNIPYDATEDELIQFFEKVGPVISFRLLRDKESQRSKGFGFCEFREKEYVQSAIRNLHNAEFKGRTLRVNHAFYDTESKEQDNKSLVESMQSLSHIEA